MAQLLSFTTCNLYNLNLPGKAIYSDADGWTTDQYNAKIAWLGRSLTDMRADVFGFQELWHADALADLMARAGIADSHVPLVPPDHDGGRIVCAGAVRKDILEDEPEWISSFPDNFKLQDEGDDEQTPDILVQIRGFSRPILHFTIRPVASQAAIHVFVVHFKSKAPTRISSNAWYDRAIQGPHAKALGSALSTIRRTAEAAAFRMLVTDRLRGNHDPLVVLGDINDATLSNTANVLTGQPNYLFGQSMGGGDDALYTVQTLQQYRSTRDVYYTHIFQNERESLDHILVSEQFYDNSRDRIWAFERMDLANDHLNDLDHKATGSNDHGIVRAVFSLDPA
ncbi:endonuclease/exonuclease/phosphatase family protein [Devosia beringensis]|uniref:endonuclease/exonuclease/phosphatase family protein n=1 Tax=Devosia beringensis TaxID=2657486 RepID=UPI00186BA250|nr:endonuclease/exonuclease/phosphatase family protein [Devosia beringensis]